MLVWLGIGTALAQAPLLLQQQGRLVDPVQHTPISGSHTLTVRLYDAESATTAVWEDTFTVDLDAGYFAVELGAAEALTVDVFDRPALYAGYALDGGAELAPRARVTSVPYALLARRAAVATSVSGGTVDATSIAIDGVTVIDGTGAFAGTLPGGALPSGCAAGALPSADGAGGWTCVDAVDTDTLAALSCDTDQVARFDGDAWACADVVDTDTDTLAALTCDADQVPRFDGDAWACADVVDTDTDTLAALTCDADQVPRFDGDAWACADVVDTDTLAALSCAPDQVARFDGDAWACADDLDTDTDTLAALSCAAGDVVQATAGGFQCAATEDLGPVAFDALDLPVGFGFLSTATCPSGFSAVEDGYVRLGAAPSIAATTRTLRLPAHTHGFSLTATSAGAHSHGVDLFTTPDGTHDHAHDLDVGNDTHSHAYDDYYWHDSGDVAAYSTPSGDDVGQRLEAARTTSSDTHDHALTGGVLEDGEHQHEVTGGTASAGAHAHAVSGSVGTGAASGDAEIAVTGDLEHVVLRLCVLDAS